MRQILFIMLAVVLTHASQASTFTFTERCIDSYQSILNLEFSQARELLVKEKQENPDNLIPVYLENYIDFLTILIGEDKETFKNLKKNKDIRMAILEKGDESSPYYYFLQAEIQLQWAFARLKFKEYITAAYEVHNAYKLLIKNQQKHPDFILNRKSLGLMYAMIGSIPSEYQWLSNLVGMNGSYIQGIKEIEKTIEAFLSQEGHPEGHYLTESLLMTTFLQLNLKYEMDDIQELQTLIQQKVRSVPLRTYALAKIAIDHGKNDEAIAILEVYNEKDSQFSFHYMQYMLGKLKVQKLDKKASVNLINYIKKFEGHNYIKSAYQKLAWLGLIHGDLESYQTNMEMIRKSGDDFVDEDKQAQREAETGQIPNVYLLKARLLTDGGYYLDALKLLAEKDTIGKYKTERDLLEYIYRLGRIYDQWEMEDSAIPYYELTITSGEKSAYYYAANSALHLGLIYEKREEFEKAKLNFEKSMSMKNKEYKTSISQKAKAGLNRISELLD